LDATRQTFMRLGHALTGKTCIVEITPTAGQTAGVEWTPAPYQTRITLHFPSMPPHTLITRGEAYRLVGLLIHELMHVYATNNAAWLDVVAEAKALREPLLPQLVNALEDCRIEALAIREAKIPAARELFATLSSHFLGEALRKGFACRNVASHTRWQFWDACAPDRKLTMRGGSKSPPTWRPPSRWQWRAFARAVLPPR
jgi:hypothetical protein